MNKRGSVKCKFDYRKNSKKYLKYTSFNINEKQNINSNTLFFECMAYVQWLGHQYNILFRENIGRQRSKLWNGMIKDQINWPIKTYSFQEISNINILLKYKKI